MVELAVEGSGIAAIKPVTVGQMFQATCRKYPERKALFYKESGNRESGNWQSVTFTQYYAHCVSAAKSFMKVRGVSSKVSLHNYYRGFSCLHAPPLAISH
jgi:hypothetical protein